MRVSINVNELLRTIDVEPNQTLLDALRDELGLSGTKECCLVGECGACTVRLNDQVVDSCLVLAVEADGGDVVTVEGLAESIDHNGPGEISALQSAFLEKGAVQCGFCTPGLIMAVHDLLARTPRPTDLEVREALSGNLCRCTGYGRVLAAVRKAADG
jgi:aerobic carbon-monoxide dehydrogenase small subunit